MNGETPSGTRTHRRCGEVLDKEAGSFVAASPRQCGKSCAAVEADELGGCDAKLEELTARPTLGLEMPTDTSRSRDRDAVDGSVLQPTHPPRMPSPVPRGSLRSSVSRCSGTCCVKSSSHGRPID